MAFQIAYWVFVACAVGFVLAIGKPFERVFVGFVLLFAALSGPAESVQDVALSDSMLLAIDLTPFVGAVIAALCFNKFWPIWFAGLQLGAVMARAAIMLSSSDMV